MTARQIGDPSKFAIEYRPKPMRAPFGAVRLWIEGAWVGDINGGMFLYVMGQRLNALRGERRERSRLYFQCTADVPSYEELGEWGSWSFGDDFDAFGLVYCAVGEEQAIHFIWQLEASDAHRHPSYPMTLQHKTASFREFDNVVGQFLREVGLPDNV